MVSILNFLIFLYQPFEELQDWNSEFKLIAPKFFDWTYFGRMLAILDFSKRLYLSCLKCSRSEIENLSLRDLFWVILSYLSYFTYLDLFWPILTYFILFWPILTYFDLFNLFNLFDIFNLFWVILSYLSYFTYLDLFLSNYLESNI